MRDVELKWKIQTQRLVENMSPNRQVAWKTETSEADLGNRSCVDSGAGDHFADPEAIPGKYVHIRK